MLNGNTTIDKWYITIYDFAKKMYIVTYDNGIWRILSLLLWANIRI